MCVGLGEGRGSVQFLAWEFALRVIFLKKFYQWSYIYLKRLIVKHVFVLVIFEGKRLKKVDSMGPFMSHLPWAGKGTELFNPVTWFLFLFFFSLSWSWMNESPMVLPFPDFPWKHCTPSLSLKSSMWETSGSVKLESPPPSLYTFGKFYYREWFYEPNHFLLYFLRHGGPSEIVLCRHYPQSPAFLVLPTMHTCLLCPLVS